MVLGCLVAEASDAERIVRALLPEVEDEDLKRLGALLLTHALAQAVHGERVVHRIAQAASQPSLGAGKDAISACEAYDEMVAANVELARKIHKSRGYQLRMAEGADPLEIEKTETRRWASTIAGYIVDSPMPAKEIVEATGDPVTTWIRLCGSRRARTLRQAARSWHKFYEWLQLAYGVTWPRSEGQIIDYLEERALEPCGHTVPSSLLQSLQLLESVGGQDKEKRLGGSPILFNVVKNLEKDLATGGPPRKTAPVFTVAMVMSAEFLVVSHQGDVARMMAYIMLLMVWGALRTDDVLWLDRSRTLLSDLGWRSVLVRSKSSGAGRKVRELPVFISRLTSLSGKDWLMEGYDLWKMITEKLPGSLFLGKPRPDASEFTTKYLDATSLATWLKWTLTQLPALRHRSGVWSPDWSEGLLDEEWAARWSGHSARHCLPSWGAAVGIPPEQRAFLGRWRSGVEVDNNAYVLTSRQIVHAAQETVVKAFCTGEPMFSEMEIFEEMRKFAVDRNLEVKGSLWRHVVWKKRGDKVAMFQQYPTLRLEPILGALGDEKEDPPYLMPEDQPEKEAPFWMSVSRKTGFRRLHRVGGCGVKPESVYKALEIHVVTAETADKKCQVCFRGELGGGDTSLEESTSGSSSSSTSDEEELEEDP